MNTKARTTVEAMRAAPSKQVKVMEKDKKTRMQEYKSTTRDREKEKERGSDRCRSRRERKIALQQDVDKLKKKLRHEENVHRALERAFTRPLGALPRLPPYLPSHTLELLAEVAVLEEEVVRLEEQVVSFRHGLYQEAIYFSSSKKTKESGSDSSSDHQLKLCHNLPNSEAPAVTKPAGSMRWSSEAEPKWYSSNLSFSAKQTVKNMTPLLSPDDWRGKENQLNANSITLDDKRANPQTGCVVANKETTEMKSSTESVLDKSSAPNKLSEDILKCLMNIYSRMSCSRTTTEQELEASPSVSSSCDSFGETDFKDPFGTCKEFGKRDIGPYKNCRAIEVSSMNQHSLMDSPLLMRRLKFLLRKLAAVDLSQLTHQQKLAFWINIYNSCMMNAFLDQGMPSNPEMLVALMPKATINVGGHLLTAMTIEHFILRLPFHSKNVSIRGTNSDNISMRRIYGLEWPEPLVTFALSCGSWSSPAVRVYTAKDVEKELETAKREYLQAAIGISTTLNKLAIPKLLDWYLLDFAKDVESLMDWICLQLPNQLRTEAVKCLEMSRSSTIPQPIQILPYEFRFRYLFAP